MKIENNLNMPNHIGIILDGNGRWAQERGLTRSLGHKAGFENIRKLSEYIFNKGIKFLSIYAFSTENFKRDKEEVDYLMKIFIKCFKEDFMFLKDKGVKVVFSGRIYMFPDAVIDAIKEIEGETKDLEEGILNICLGYGGQYEILDMTKKIAEKVNSKEINIEDIDLEMIRKNLYQDLPELDFVIRTSGELRLSNFMLYQGAYAEFYFPKTYFPDFNEEEFDKAIEEYNKRERKFGGNSK